MYYACVFIVRLWIDLDELEAEGSLDVQLDLHLPLIDLDLQLLLHLFPLLLIRTSRLL